MPRARRATGDGPTVLAIDQGTSSTRSILFGDGAVPLAREQRELAQRYPGPGLVEHDPERIWRDVLGTARAALRHGDPARVAAIGIANQRETVVVWDRETGAPIHPAIVWQDRRTAARCDRLRSDGAEPLVRARTGLLLDPYFSATKLAWLLDAVPGARHRAEDGHLAFGTVDSFLLWRLTGGRVHATDVSNASRTLLFDIHRRCWDPELLRLFGIPEALLPAVRDNDARFGDTDRSLFGRAIAVGGMAGDQQAAMIGQACLAPGLAKSTYGTGCFMLLNTGADAVASASRLLTTIAFRLGGRTSYALEGAIFTAGAAIGWLRRGLGLVPDAAQTGAMAASVPDDHGVFMVPGFVGLGAPHWDPQARGLICGLTLDSTASHLVRAALECVAFQTLDLADAMRRDGAAAPRAVRIDGGMAANDWFCRFLADMLQVPVERPRHLETTARGAALLAGLATGVWPDPAALAATWTRGAVFEPGMEASRRAARIVGWQDALRRALTPPGPVDQPVPASIS